MTARDRYVWETSDRPTDPLGHSTVSLGGLAQGLGAPSLTRRTVLRTLGQPINYRDDGVSPTGGTGFPLLADEVLIYDGDPALFQMILSSTATGNADVRLAFYG